MDVHRDQDHTIASATSQCTSFEFPVSKTKHAVDMAGGICDRHKTYQTC